MAEDPEPARLRALEDKIAAVRKARTAPARPHQGEHYSQAQLAWRMVIELVAGLAIGAGMGYGLDLLFGTGPILMVIFLFLGLAAGVKTMVGTANEVRHGAAEQAGPVATDQVERAGRPTEAPDGREIDTAPDGREEAAADGGRPGVPGHGTGRAPAGVGIATGSARGDTNPGRGRGDKDPGIRDDMEDDGDGNRG